MEIREVWNPFSRKYEYLPNPNFSEKSKNGIKIDESGKEDKPSRQKNYSYLYMQIERSISQINNPITESRTH